MFTPKKKLPEEFFILKKNKKSIIIKAPFTNKKYTLYKDGGTKRFFNQNKFFDFIKENKIPLIPHDNFKDYCFISNEQPPYDLDDYILYYPQKNGFLLKSKDKKKLKQCSTQKDLEREVAVRRLPAFLGNVKKRTQNKNLTKKERDKNRYRIVVDTTKKDGRKLWALRDGNKRSREATIKRSMDISVLEKMKDDLEAGIYKEKKVIREKNKDDFIKNLEEKYGDIALINGDYVVIGDQKGFSGYFVDDLLELEKK